MVPPPLQLPAAPIVHPSDPAAALGARRCDAVSDAIASVLVDRGVTGGDVRFERQDAGSRPGFVRTQLAVDVPGEVEPIASALASKVGQVAGGSIERVKADHEGITLSVKLDGAEVASVDLYPTRPIAMAEVSPVPDATPSKPRIAIVIDDIGYSKEPVEKLLALGGPLTFSVLPYGPASTELAETIHASGSEVMLHLPMEPVGNPGGVSREGMLLANMPAEMLKSRFAEAVLQVPHADGVNNHMGSRLTADPGAMKVVMEEVKAKGLFFLDSRTSADSVAFRTARAEGVPAAERNVFLDDVAQVAPILEQVKELEKIARRRGVAVAIGHPYPATVDALKKAIPQLAKDGFELVPASDVVSKTP